MEVIRNFSLLKRRFLILLTNILLILALSAGCSTNFFPTQIASEPPTPVQTETPTASPVPEAVVTFNVTLPTGGSDKSSVFIDLLDEVTGLGLNPTRYRMQPAGLHQFSIKLPIRVGELVKYRYVRDSQFPMVEYTPSSQQVRYRLLEVSNPMTVQDIVSGWIDTPYKGPTGRISGKIVRFYE